MKNKVLLILSSGFILSPLIIIWWMSDYDRYLYLISGPFPFSSLGSAPFQIVFSALMVLIGSAGVLFWSSLNRKNADEDRHFI